MKPHITAGPDRLSQVQIEMEARRMRAEVIRAAGRAIGRFFARLLGRNGGSRRPIQA